MGHVRKLFANTFAELGVALTFTHNEMLAAKIGPGDLLFGAQCMVMPQDNENLLIPKRERFAAFGIACIDDECDIKLPLADCCHDIGRRTLQNLKADPGMTRTIDLYQLAQVAC